MIDDDLTSARILIVDDQLANVRLLDRLLRRAGYTALTGTTDPRRVMPLFSASEPDLVILDLHMPHLDGFALMQALGPAIPRDTYLPLLVMTADITPEAKQRALAMGAKDFLTKPFDTTETLLRIRNLLETRRLHLQLQRQNQTLEEKVEERTQELAAAQLEILERLALAAEYRDDDTGQHTQRVGRIAALLARALGWPAEQGELIGRAAPLHDLGKIGIPDWILLKPEKLTADEFARMQQHTNVGARILSGSRFPLLQLAEEIAHTHHERWDGAGYTGGLRGEAIPIAGRIVAVADVFDALTHERPYKRAWPVEEAVAEITRQSGSQFDPAVVEAFTQVLPEVLRVVAEPVEDWNPARGGGYEPRGEAPALSVFQ